jgi:hypothetical protein
VTPTSVTPTSVTPTKETVMTLSQEQHIQSGVGPAEQKAFDSPDETREFPNGRVDLLRIGGSDIGRLTLQPGWRWSDHVKPIAGTDLCEAPHFQFHAAGTLHVLMADGTEFDAHQGDVTALPQGHDAWVVGDVPVVLIDWWGASNYAK